MGVCVGVGVVVLNALAPENAATGQETGFSGRSPRRVDFHDRSAAKIWIVSNQFVWRNLTPYQRAELALVLVSMPSRSCQASSAVSCEAEKRGVVHPGPMERLIALTTQPAR